MIRLDVDKKSENNVTERTGQSRKTVDYLWILFWFVFISFFVIFIAITCTVKLSLDNPIAQQNNAVFGTWDSTGAAIILIGFPFLILYTIHLYKM